MAEVFEDEHGFKELKFLRGVLWALNPIAAFFCIGASAAAVSGPVSGFSLLLPITLTS